MTIFFYEVDDPYGGFSNFSPHGIALEGYWWTTTEHYFQAQKFAGTPYAHWVRLAVTPKLAAEIGRDHRLPLRPDWEQVKEEVMRRALLRKCETHAPLREILLATGDEPMVERNVLDAYWGCGPDGSGHNKLGNLLMEVRAVLRAKQNKTPPDGHCLLDGTAQRKGSDDTNDHQTV